MRYYACKEIKILHKVWFIIYHNKFVIYHNKQIIYYSTSSSLLQHLSRSILSDIIFDC